MERIRHILCAVDLSEQSEFALTYAVLLAGKLNARVTALYAYQLAMPPYPEDAAPMIRRVDDVVRETRTRELEQMAERCGHGGVRIEPKVVQGIAHEQIVAEAKALGADLVVTGTHGRTGLPHFLLGSVAERVVRMCPVPVLTVPKPHAQAEGPE